MNIHNGSVIKAGGLAAVVALLLGLLTLVIGLIPFLGDVLVCLLAPLVCLGWFLIPLGAGVGYGYLAPGKETVSESALGGALAGGFAGLVYGILSGIANATGAGAVAVMQQTDVAVDLGAGAILIALCGPTLVGLVLGALGGVVWPLFQRA
ncbi:MAG: hypothetical protein R3272_00585 [Candidatus Promineifilaceae bacterium]|nr:hypothetical protein [Candidatus Promineifilaceae bacterium]